MENSLLQLSAMMMTLAFCFLVSLYQLNSLLIGFATLSFKSRR